MSGLCPTCGGGTFPGRQITDCPDAFHGKREAKGGKEAALALALMELQGFAERNMVRAIAAHVDAKREQEEHNSEATRINVIVQETRIHEAQRFLLVIRDRTAEAMR